MKTILITEEQYRLIQENKVTTKLVQSLHNELSKRYEPVDNTYDRDDELKGMPMLRNKMNGEEIAPKEVLRRFSHKHEGLSEKFLKQVIMDWFNGTSEDGMLSKPVTP